MVTKHEKLELVSPALSTLALVPRLVDEVDTDTFGTFSGDIPRSASAEDTVVAKARAGLDTCPSAELSVASEGSFGPHPYLPFVPGGVELVALVGRDGHFIVGVDVTTETNFASLETSSEEGVGAFLERIGFPSHAVLVGPKRSDLRRASSIVKGITNHDTLRRELARIVHQHGTVLIETDMRAHMNPTRRQAITRAAEDMVRRARVACPRCGKPGFYFVEAVPGRPCSQCGYATGKTKERISACRGCRYRQVTPAEGSPYADPYHCPECNP
ncbi:MAG: DUF6671 family protein [Polyangiaceae bacterium]